MNYYPDNWVVLKLSTEYDTMYKLLAGWSGGYLDGDSWRINSGITRCEMYEDMLAFYGETGSCYYVHKDTYRLSMATAGIYDQIKMHYGEIVTMLEADADWLNIDYT